MQTNLWTRSRRRYFPGDPPQDCYIEKNEELAGTPLWPLDPSFHPDPIAQNIQRTAALLKKIGGHCFAGHVPLKPERKVNGLQIATRPTPLASAFVSGWLIPQEKISASQIGFYPKAGAIPPLAKTIEELKGTWLFINLGFFLTQKLIDAHNTRHPADEQLSPKAQGYLGGFFIRQGKELVGYPPHFGTCGVGVTKQGRPVLIDAVTLRGGSVWLDNTRLDWQAEDINKRLIFTPALTGKTPLGEGKINIVIFNEGTGTHPIPKIAYFKEGAIRQPAAGIVFSLEQSLFKKLNIQPTAHVRFEFEPWFDQKLWASFTTFYEGLIKFSPDGQPVFDPWLHPNAILTQETFIPNHYRREPRAVLVQTPRYFGAFVFSGRYEHSIGVSFAELVPLLKKIIGKLAPEESLQKIIGLDSGSAAKLCLIEAGKAFPLSWVAPGTRNRMGDPNGNTYSSLLLKLDH